MYYFEYDGMLCGTPDKSLADTLASEVAHIPDGKSHIDFGGSLAGEMSVSKVINYTFYAHHLTALTSVLRDRLNSGAPYVVVPSITCGHVMRAETAQAMLSALQADWERYMAAERANLDAWEVAYAAIHQADPNFFEPKCK